MSGNSFGRLFVVTTFGESHGRALGCIVDGCPPGLEGDLSHREGRQRQDPGTTTSFDLGVESLLERRGQCAGGNTSNVNIVDRD